MTRTDDARRTQGEPPKGVPDGGVESSIAPGGSAVGTDPSRLRGVVRLLRGETRDIELRTRIRSLDAEIDVLDARVDEDDRIARAHIESARGLLTDAKRRLDRGRVEEAWGHYHAARRFQPRLLESVGDGDALSTGARAVYEDAQDALSGAPRRTVVALLTDESGVKAPPTAAELAAAMRALHDQYERVALTRRYLQSQFNQLLLQGSVSLVLLFALAVGAVYDISPLLVEPLTTTDLRSIGFALHVVLVGIIGASVFGMRTLRDQPLSTRTTQRTPGLFVTGARVFVGATSALFLVFVLFTELVSFDQAITAPMALAVAFAGGYSERLAPQAVDTVSQVVPTDAETEQRSPPTGDDAGRSRSADPSNED